MPSKRLFIVFLLLIVLPLLVFVALQQQDIRQQAKTFTDKTGVNTGPFKGEYFNNIFLSGSPILVRNDDSINFGWAFGSPFSSLSSDNFSVRWTKDEEFLDGIYTFTVRHDDGMRIYMDDELIYNSWFGQGASIHTITVPVSEGTHNLKIEYFELSGQAEAKVAWSL